MKGTIYLLQGDDTLQPLTERPYDSEGLRRVVEFLDRFMNPVEVLAVEVQQYVGKGLRTLVPRVIGQTEATKARKTSGSASPRRRPGR